MRTTVAAAFWFVAGACLQVLVLPIASTTATAAGTGGSSSSSSSNAAVASTASAASAAATATLAAATASCPTNQQQPSSGVAPRLERSFFAIKPDGLQRGLVGEIVSRFERKGWKLIALKMLTPTPSLVERHYEEHAGKAFFPNLVDYLSSSPVVAMVWEGADVIAGGRKMLGATNPLDAEVGTIRGDLCTNAGKNLVHASDGLESAEREIALWFKPEELWTWTRSVDPWVNKSL